MDMTWNSKVVAHLETIATYLKGGAETRLRHEKKSKRDQTKNSILMFMDGCKALRDKCPSYEENMEDYDALERREKELRDLVETNPPPTVEAKEKKKTKLNVNSNSDEDSDYEPQKRKKTKKKKKKNFFVDTNVKEAKTKRVFNRIEAIVGRDSLRIKPWINGWREFAN